MTVQIRPKTLARQARFLEKYLVSRTVALAAARAEVAPVTVYKWRRENPEFKAAFDRRRDAKRYIRCLGRLPVLEWNLPIKSIVWAPSP